MSNMHLYVNPPTLDQLPTGQTWQVVSEAALFVPAAHAVQLWAVPVLIV